MGIDYLSETLLIDRLSAAEKQMVELGRLMWLATLYKRDNPILILDEPTTVLTKKERDILFASIKELKKSSSFFFISHSTEEVLEVSDRVVVLRDGNLIDIIPIAQASKEKIESLIIGSTVHSSDKLKDRENYEPQKDSSEKKECVLSVQNLSLNNISDISFNLYAGEILSFVGLIGSGKEDIIDMFFGLQDVVSGKIEVKNAGFNTKNPYDTINMGIGLIPIDRRSEGVATELSVTENLTLFKLPLLKSMGLLNKHKEKDYVASQIEKYNIKTRSLDTQCKFLSGGNQQKVVVSKWFSANYGIYILNHPTRGIDVKAKREIYSFLKEMTSQGISFIVLCDSLEEDIGLADRIVLMKNKKIVEVVNVELGLAPPDLLRKIL